MNEPADERTNRLVPGSATAVDPIKPTVPKGSTSLTTDPDRSIRWKPLLLQSGFFLGMQHGFRLATEKGAREELKGPFFKDWIQSVKGLEGWSDGDPFLVNYIGHPMQGAVAGYLLIHNDPKHKADEFGMNKHYWKGQLKAMAYSAAYSTQFEIGPISEASIGNIGGKPQYRAGYVDLVVTPFAGTVWQVTEDFLDRFIIVKFEEKVKNGVLRVLVRGGLNPARSFANMMQFRVPWSRDNRGGAFQK